MNQKDKDWNIGRMPNGLLTGPFGDGTRSGRSVSCAGGEPRLLSDEVNLLEYNQMYSYIAMIPIYRINQ